ncbi:MAG: hypothetical protein EBU90_26405 [Proteobacteria bacterium]|nr:hypothetical protein [Pseudomonadota bacterium]
MSFKKWLENNEKKMLILVHPDCVTEVSESTTNEYDALLKNHIGRFDYVITHLFYPKNYTDWMQKDSPERFASIQKIRETVRGLSNEVIEAERERCSYGQNIPDYLINNPGVMVYMAGGYEDNCLWTSYIRLFSSLHDVLREGNHGVYWYRPLIFQDTGHGLQGTKKYRSLDPEEIQMDRERPELVPDRGALRFHPDKVNYRNEALEQLPGTTKFSYNNIGPNMKQYRKVPVRDFHYEDELGGSATGWIKGRLASITRMDSVPIDKRYSSEGDKLKRRGFFKKLLYDLSKSQVSEIEIGLQSSETQKAIARLIEKRILEEVPQKSIWGDRFTKYKINVNNLIKDLNNTLLTSPGVGSDNLGYAESSNAVDPEMLGELFNRDPYELVSFLREKLRENSSLRFNIVADWVDVNTARGAKAILDSWGSRLNIDSFTVRATPEQYAEDPNAFESGVSWEKI